MSKLLDLEGMSGKATERYGNVPQISPLCCGSHCPHRCCAKLGCSACESAPAALRREAQCLLLLAIKEKKAKQTKKKNPNNQTIPHRTDLLLKTLCNIC